MGKKAFAANKTDDVFQGAASLNVSEFEQGLKPDQTLLS